MNAYYGTPAVSEEQDLIAAIVAAPDDDDPRMVYADWLMQRGDPRGELIALQCQLARLDRADAEIEPALYDRERTLRDAYDFASLLAIADLMYELRRGLVEHVEAYRRFDHELLDRVAEEAPLLRSITVPGNMVGALTPAWKRFESIIFHEACYLREEQVRAFVESPDLVRLRRLHIAKANFSEETALTALFDIAQPLTHFGLVLARSYSTPEFDGAPIVEAIAAKQWPLRSLYLGGCDILDLAPLAKLPLVHLALHDCKTPAVAVAALPELETLELDYNSNHPGAVDFRALFEALPRLRRLRIRGAKIGESRAIELAAHGTQLRRLDISGNRISKTGITKILEMPNLVWLAIDRNPALDEGKAPSLPRYRVMERSFPRYPADVLEELRNGNRISAIKHFRAQNGVGLLEAKLAVERIEEEVIRPREPPTLSWLPDWNLPRT